MVVGRCGGGLSEVVMAGGRHVCCNVQCIRVRFWVFLDRALLYILGSLGVLGFNCFIRAY